MDILEFINKGEYHARKEKESKQFFQNSCKPVSTENMTKNVIFGIHDICQRNATSHSKWMTKRAELFSILYIFQRECLVRKVKNTDFVNKYFSDVCPLLNIPRYKSSLLFLFRRNKEFSQLCKKNITEIEDYINGKNCETDTTPSPTANV